MQEVIVNMLPFAVGIAISPVPIITVILMLFTPRPAGNALGFLAGWVLGIGLPALAVLVFALRSGDEPTVSPSSAMMYLRLTGGILLLLLSWWKWMHRNQPDEPGRRPVLMRMVDLINPWKAVLVGFLFADVTNPKNMALTVAGCLAINEGGLAVAGQMVMLVLFTVIASAGVALPVLVYLSGGAAAQDTVERWRQWLVRHQHAVMAVLFLVFGLALVARSGFFNIGPLFQVR